MKKIYVLKNYNYKGEILEFEQVESLPKIGDKESFRFFGDKEDKIREVVSIKELDYIISDPLNLYIIYYNNNTCKNVAIEWF